MKLYFQIFLKYSKVKGEKLFIIPEIVVNYIIKL